MSAVLLSQEFLRVNILSDHKELEGCGSWMTFGGFWNVAGSPSFGGILKLLGDKFSLDDLYKVTNNQDLRVYVNNPSELNLEGSVAAPDWASPASGSTQGAKCLLRQQITHSNQEGSPEPKLNSGGRLLVGRPSIVSDVMGTHNEGKFDVKAQESHGPAHKGTIEKEYSGGVMVRKGWEDPGTVHPLRMIFQIILEWVANEPLDILKFFFF
ncbi:hypothetical protein BDM02DRAFT_3132513 [Thelephora ganbajun]|uniref:Uncharacterized protein n=1 Tax=Thelephora ganbajun TaxID=370292 RepID=A0ACB6Z216_THEGA|nr:hypothetical protein BDM02DRAFT_3132513 [Thelephora ganbajun]